MPVQGRTALVWKTLRTTWDDPEAQAYLAEPLQLPLPTSGPLHGLLAKTKKLIRTLGLQVLVYMPAEVAEVAQAHGCIAVLVKIMHWTQQIPCKELHSLENREGTYEAGSLWWLVTSALGGIISALYLRTSGEPETYREILRQFEQVPGKLLSQGMQECGTGLLQEKLTVF